MKEQKQIIISLCILAAICLITLSPLLHNGFTNWDDPDLITENVKIREISWHNISTIFVSRHIDLYHPLVLMTYMLEYHFIKLDPFYYHLTNLLLHISNCLLVFWFIYLLKDKVFFAFLSAALFALHPLSVESAAWITERKNVLYAFFYLLTLISYIYYQRSKSMRYYSLSLAAFLLSLLSKTTTVTLPLILLLLDYYKKERIDRKNLMLKIPFFALSLIFGIVGILIYEKVTVAFPLHKKILNAFYILTFYLYKIFLPARLSVIYPNPPADSIASHLFYYGSPVVIFILAILIVLSLKKSNGYFWGAAFYLITVSATLQIMPTAGAGIVFDRYTYIPIIGIIFIFMEIFHKVSWRFSENNRHIFIYTVSLLIIIPLCLLSYARCGVWKSSITLWEDAVRNYPGIAAARGNLGNAYKEIGEYQKALSSFDNALKLNKDFAEAYNNRGVVLSKMGKHDEAFLNFNQAIRLKPSYYKALNNRGTIYMMRRDYRSAYNDFSKAILEAPFYAEAYKNRAVASIRLGKFAEALDDFNNAALLNPYDAEIYNNLGNFFLERKEYGSSVNNYDKALSLNRDYIEAYANRAVANYYLNNYEASLRDVQAAEKLGHTFNPSFLQALQDKSK